MPPLALLRDHEWTLPSLVAELGPLCAHLPAGGDERVSPAPDERTIRYYQSTGLLDWPLRYDGRVAIYGYRNLLQALATKALQSQGLSLAQVQTALAGRSTAELEAAVAPALGQLAPPSPPAPGPRALVAYALAPGVVLSIDPGQVPDPAALAQLLASTLSNRSTP